MTILAVGPGGWVGYQRNRWLRETAAVAKLQANPAVEIYARHDDWLWTLLAGRSARPVVGIALRRANDADMKPLSELHDLVWVDVVDNQITDAGVANLANLASLKRLRLDGTLLTDEGVASLAGLTQLEMLNLSGTQVTDAGLRHLEGLYRLESLDLQKTAVTDAGASRLQQALPNLQVNR